MLPKLQKQQCEHINLEKIIAEARPIVAGPVYHTSVISEILHIITESSLAMISHIAKDSFSFKSRLYQHCVLVILNHYILIFHMIFFIQQLNTGLQNDLPLLRRFNK